MLLYHVCYFKFNPKINKWEITQEYPLSKNAAFLRMDYLKKSIKSLIWLKEKTITNICEDCEHCYWEEEQNENYCSMHGIFIPGDWSCPDFDNINHHISSTARNPIIKKQN
ncbi:hypothetical protein HS141_11295 [Cetobacterium somerae]|uniref:hypothetical protein n=1 Tax=Cetobacterium somerae TaxID=188913 RepID=UPI00211EC46B|nr:hypothetical protein [Cetobacterium somerae]MCQ9627516.1 hypothetical protein [Cetobacterium somerae]